MRNTVRWAVIVAAVLMLRVGAFAQVGEVETVRMTVHPASPPVPALRYTFRPDIVKETPGNAADLYKEVAAEIGDLPDEVGKWRQLPPDQLPIEQVRAVLDEYLPPERWEKLVAASLCRQIDWETDLRQKGMSVLLPHLRPARDLARLIALRAQVQIRDGDYAQTVETLAVGFALAEDVQSDSLVVAMLVGEGINRLMLEQVRAMQQLDNAPNLYWALADLPQPLVRFHEAMRRERRVAEFTFPALRQARHGELDEKAFRQLVGQMAGMIGPAAGLDAETGPDIAEGIEATVEAAIAPAREYFTKHGWTEQRIDEVPRHQLVGLYMIDMFDAAYDDVVKWTALPYWVGFERLRAQWDAREIPADGRMNLLMMFMPPFSRAWTTAVERDRELAAMQIVEGLRAYAAGHDGRLPESLDALTDTPASLDPSTGKPFGYRVEGRTATIESPPLAGGGRKGLRYEMTIALE